MTSTADDARMPISNRLRSLDITRLFVILMMFVAHWWGILKRFPGPHADVSLYLSRIATPGFVTVFGLTAGYAYWYIYITNPRELRRKLLARGAKTAKYALLVAIPGFVTLVHQGRGVTPQWVYGTYSVLMFYSLAIPSMLLVFPIIRRRPTVLAPLAAAALWIAGDLLRRVWPSSASPWIEYPRLLLVSGAYSYFNLMAIAVTLIPVGTFLRRAGMDRASRRSALSVVAAIGASICVGALLVAALTGEFSARDVITGAAKYPPRLWYFSHFAGMTLCIFGLMGVLEASHGDLPRWLRPLATIGKSPLQVYAAETFVLPAARALAWVSGVRTDITFALAFIVFASYCAWLARPRPTSPTVLGPVS